MLNRKLISILIYMLLSVILISCSEKDVCNYNGYQIVVKSDALVGKFFRFRKDGIITGRVYVVEYDWNRYNVGDTLYCQ
jgi:hypothetical protein